MVEEMHALYKAKDDSATLWQKFIEGLKEREDLKERDVSVPSEKELIGTWICEMPGTDIKIAQTINPNKTFTRNVISTSSPAQKPP